jgi:AAA domain
MANKYEVPADKLTWLCDLSLLPFNCTADMTPLVDFIGQERAIRAIQFGLGVDKPGFNIFVTGLTGTGKTSIIKAFLKKITTERIPADAEPPSRRIGVTSTISMIRIGLKYSRFVADGARP